MLKKNNKKNITQIQLVLIQDSLILCWGIVSLAAFYDTSIMTAYKLIHPVMVLGSIWRQDRKARYWVLHSPSPVALVLSVGYEDTARQLEMLQGLKKRGARNYTFCPILMKNRGRNTTFSSFLLKYRGQNSRVKTIQIFQRPEKGGLNIVWDCLSHEGLWADEISGNYPCFRNTIDSLPACPEQHACPGAYRLGCARRMWNSLGLLHVAGSMTSIGSVRGHFNIKTIFPDIGYLL